MNRTDTWGNAFHSLTLIEDDERYWSTLTLSNSNGVTGSWIDGRFELKNDFLIDTMTRHSNPNAPVPSPFRVRILDDDGSTLTLQWEDDANQAVFHRETD